MNDSDRLTAENILATARSGQAPSTWVVWPLRRDYIVKSILRWLALSLVGFLLFIPASIAVAPNILNESGFQFVITGVIMILLAALAFGALGITIYDLLRLLRAKDYWLIITPDEYVKATPGGKLTYVPVDQVESVTLKGVPVAMDTADNIYVNTTAPGKVGFIFGPAIRNTVARRQRNTPTSLAFVDGRTNKEVVVATDAAFDDLHGIEYVLNMQADAKRRQLNRSRTG